MAITRLETPSQFRTNVTRQIILALRDVFGTSIFSQDFTNGINVVNSYPLTEIKYPAIVVTVNVRVNRNAGVGHTEEFQDMTTGMMRSWQHRYFEGEVEFTVGETTHALSAGTLLALDGGITHAVHSAHGGIFLLTVVRGSGAGATGSPESG